MITRLVTKTRNKANQLPIYKFHINIMSERKRPGEKIKKKDNAKILKTDKSKQVKTEKKLAEGDKKMKKESGKKAKPGPDTKITGKGDTKSPYFDKTDAEDEASIVDSGEASDGSGENSKEDETSKNTARLKKSFYEKSCDTLAKALLGKLLVRIHNGERLTGRIIETEAYLGRRDKAAHSYKGKTDRNAAMFMDPGTAYVYNIYGMYCCMNISSQGEGEAVLIRSLEPVEGKATMSSFRMSNKKNTTAVCKPMKDKDLCNGPSKLTQALSINKADINQVDMTTSGAIWLEEGDVPVPESKMVVSKRINIGYSEEWADKPLRFYELGNPCVSVKDKEVEKAMKEAKS